ncbi:hypothetical protein BDV96DRAFT_608376 [Lophiotrema nucula]|uniref:Uncharacterized protein n=1 Tax=Lophiotrema nucula TaxID=690887 RepID=A0A6A5YG50_9PLEO|nr:hypothetical protein BDV96DRAFT_608376 [Lophiotrema nucula]
MDIDWDSPDMQVLLHLDEDPPRQLSWRVKTPSKYRPQSPAPPLAPVDSDDGEREDRVQALWSEQRGDGNKGKRLEGANEGEMTRSKPNKNTETAVRKKRTASEVFGLPPLNPKKRPASEVFGLPPLDPTKTPAADPKTASRRISQDQPFSPEELPSLIAAFHQHVGRIVAPMLPARPALPQFFIDPALFAAPQVPQLRDMPPLTPANVKTPSRNFAPLPPKQPRLKVSNTGLDGRGSTIVRVEEDHPEEDGLTEQLLELQREVLWLEGLCSCGKCRWEHECC